MGMFKLSLKKFSLYYVVVTLFCFAFAEAVNAKDIRIALRAHQGSVKSLSLWQATADHLSKHIPEHRFILVPFENIGVMNQAVSRGDYQVVLTNPSATVEYQLLYGYEPLVSLVNKRHGKGYSKFGSVIFTLSNRTDINSFKDLKNKSLISVDELAFGGWRVAWKEFLKEGINPYDYFKEIQFAGGAQQEVVYAVMAKKGDIGVVRTNMLERLAASGKIDLKDFKVLGQKKTKGFPFLHSTDLYPEWAFSASQDIEPKLKNKIAQTLLSIAETDKAAVNAMYKGWVLPLDYSPVDRLLKELKVGPYNIATMGAYERLVSQYGIIFFSFMMFLFLLLFAFIYVLKLNKQILSAKEALKKEADMTSNLERQLMHSQRIESLGQLTGGIAHDFNNMLASIMGYTELAISSKAIKNDKKVVGYLEQVLTASSKSSDLINQMLAFSRVEEDRDEQEDVLISSLVSDVYLLLKPILPSSIHLSTEDFDKKLFVNINLSMMTQVIMNLYLNAKDAMVNNNGSISFSVDVVNYDALEKFCNSCHQDVRGEFIAISITDDGCGILADSIEHLFDPFYTTKEVGKGTGMGLSMVHGIVHKYDGHIFVESVIDKGTTIKILLPKKVKSEKLTIPTTVLEKTIDTSNSRNALIMVVDDEVSLTIYLKELLQNKGFKVVSFNDSEKALSYFKENVNDVDLVITDQTMPILSGIDMAGKMIEYANDLPIILCSGFSETLTVEVREHSKIRQFLEKPIQSNKLLETIYLILNN